MKNNYPTFPNEAGIGSGVAYPIMPPQVNPVEQNHLGSIPMQPHAQIRLTPQPGQADPVKASQTMYNPQGETAFNPWGNQSGT